MGIVKFGQKTYTIDGIPDGLTLIKEDELGRLREQSDAFHELHARLPLGTDESKITESLEKGKRYDALAKERDELKKSGKDLEGKLKSREDIPEDYNRERWDKYVTTEKRAIRQEKLDKLTEEALVKAEKEAGTKVSIDPRFIDKEKVDALDLDAKDAGDKLYKILDDGHTAQMEFVKKSVGKGMPSQVVGSPVDGGARTPEDRRTQVPKDEIGPNGIRIQSL